MNRIKEEIADNPVQSEDDLRELIRRIAEELGITLSDEEGWVHLHLFCPSYHCSSCQYCLEQLVLCLVLWLDIMEQRHLVIGQLG